MTSFDADTYKEALRNVAIPCLITDTNFVIRDINTAGLEFTGYSYDEVVGEFATVISGDDDIYADIVETVLDDEVWTGDFELRTKSGELVYGQGSAAPVVVDGETRGFVAVFLDTTKQRQYENTSEVLNRLLRHDLRNDMNVLYGYVQRAQSRSDDEEVVELLARGKEYVTEIIRKSERARNLRQHLEQTYEATNRPVRLDHALNDATVEMIHEYDEAEFHFDTYPPVRVVADHLLSTVFETIIENAVVHNDKAVPTVEIRVEKRETDVVVSVGDNGPGVLDESRDVIFGREEIDQLHHGSGISLFFTDNVVDSYGGDIWVEGNDPEGAVFNVRLLKT